MWRSASERQRWLFVVAGFALILAAANIWWVSVYRHGYPLSIDEAGYTTFGVIDFLAFKNGGLSDWWQATQSTPPTRPSCRRWPRSSSS